ncbi:TadE/TadG family type IV pilus assembly protein [Sphingomonas sp. ERG5]|uniref:TadE/TadG family type IV pilus assembly protein n=1 Tax=Sphingomonas sp. ERG5 TaxID=1381597 RepID=UPI00054C2F7B|nr:TadE/TadG family type IV pilus assembly protein [Sphingomonas sp. ERG5]
MPLLSDRRGSAVVEFAIVAPVLCLLLLGIFDTAHSLYMRSVLQGIIQKVARDSALESGTASAQQTALDNKVRTSVNAVANNATMTFTRRYYRTFSDAAAAKAETWTDTNGNGTCDPPSGGTPGEPYIDANNNNKWDSDGGNDGQGGAKDRVLYTVVVSYPRFFPLYNFLATDAASRDAMKVTKITASTVLENQPYSEQGSYGAPVTRNCP